MPAEPKDLLLADLAHFGDSLLRNEEGGEKRMNFFITLVTAVIAALGALAAAERGFKGTALTAIASFALAALLVFGLMTWLRMVRRNRVSAHYRATLKNIRKLLADGVGLSDYEVPVKPAPAGWRGGYAQTTAAIEALLAAALVGIQFPPGGGLLWIGLAFVLVLGGLLLAGKDAAPGGPVPEAGAVACRRGDGGLEFLLVTSRSSRSEWVFPKGHIEQDEPLPAAALRELGEEAGVGGRLLGRLGSLSFRSKDEKVRVAYFLVEVPDARGLAGEGRDVQWLPADEAMRRLSHDDARELLGRAVRQLEGAHSK